MLREVRLEQRRTAQVRPFCSDCAEVVSYLNGTTGTRYRSQDGNGERPAILDDLHKRHAEFSVADCKTVIDKKADRWIGTDMAVYLRPSTLFRPSHFEEYLNEIGKAFAERDYYGRCLVCAMYDHGASKHRGEKP
jgi:uncharacterized phage protein (TIGR02220 family)